MMWSEICEASALSMTGLLTFMERWQPGSTSGMQGASVDEIGALAGPLGGTEALPPVYRDFLATMGASTGELALMWGTTSIRELLASREEERRERPDPRRYLKFAVGDQDYNGRHPDDFFDLARRTPDGFDAAMIRIHEKHLVSGKVRPEEPFANFSDLVRAVTVVKLALRVGTDRSVLSFDFGTRPDTTGRVYDFFFRLGFKLTELGASSRVVPLEHREKGAIALLRGPWGEIPRARVRLRARDPAQTLRYQELLADHERELTGG